MTERRSFDRPGAPERRSFPRPPLWLNLFLLLLGVAGILFARHHRDQVSKEFADVIAEEQRTPADVRKIKNDLAEMDLERNALKDELAGRSKFLASLKSENFYLSIDSRERKLRFYYGNTVLREADVTPGPTKTITANGKTWTFVPVKGAFTVEAKIAGHSWTIPEWVYAMNGEPVPAERPTIKGALGDYVIFLGNGYVIHTPPRDGSPLHGPKPGSYMIDEQTMRAIWARIHKGETPVYIF